MKYKKYITGLKGFSYIMVMLGHFLNIVRSSSYMSGNFNTTLRIVNNSRVGLFIRADFWLYLFFVVSGYLICSSEIKSFKQFVAKCIKRFFRLALPILSAYAIIYLIYLFVGFHNAETVSLFKNSWYQGFYNEVYSIKTVLLAPFDVLFLKIRVLNSPYWVLKDMFVSSILMYFALYILNKMKLENIFYYFVMLGFFIISMLISDVSASCFLGFILYWFEKNNVKLTKIEFFNYFMLAILLLLCSRANIIYIRVLFFLILVLLTPKMGFVNKIVSSKIFEFFGNIGFGIYSFHWPIFCSFGAIIILYMSNIVSLTYAILIAIVSSILLTIFISYIYNRIFESFFNYIIEKLYRLFIV